MLASSRRLLILATTAVTALTLTAAPSLADSARASRFMNAATEMCLAVGKGEVKAGKKVIQWPCSNNKDQKWIYRGRRLTNAKTGMCLAIPQGTERKGTNAVQWPCTDGGNEQEWVYDGTQHLRNRATGQCLAVGKAEAKEGKWLIQWPCRNGAEQVWVMR